MTNRVLFFCFILGLSSCGRKDSSHTVDAELRSDQTATILPITPTVNMRYIPGGEYLPFYGAIDTNRVKVPPFLIDERAVTNQEFLDFVTVNPKWRKSQVMKIYADTAYLTKWPSDLELPKGAKPDAPVCYVSWFAAKAFAKSVGKRLPKLDEWEFIAMADTDTPNARSKKEYSTGIIDLYLVKNRQYQSVKKGVPNYWGVYDMFDLIWEWTDDFNSILSVGDSRTGAIEGGSLFCAAGATSATDVSNYAAFMRFAMRTSVKANYAIANLGFRCAKDTILAPIVNVE
ncbi:formylglycine-generating enzyme family protein [Sphingobacterium sp. xlx-130]|uniref:formylglycine-generating enzyme family protein n=1 Tax=Sphingobacterium sp. xlx-130 TaxID=2654323 RepID=UPI0013DCF82E|nr:formylglycine-generating enzyme family protein [Sphingobacterium sp. xlx-130]